LDFSLIMSLALTFRRAIEFFVGFAKLDRLCWQANCADRKHDGDDQKK